MKHAIGGYFGLENHALHTMPLADSVALNSARNALEYILRCFPNLDCVLVPRYICPVVLQPFSRQGRSYSFYDIDAQLRPILPRRIAKDEVLLAVNYFGVCDQLMSELCCRFAGNMIIDASQAFYFRSPLGIPTFNSARKFFGVPDGGFAFHVPSGEIILDRDCSHDRCAHLLKRIDVGAECGYADFATNEERLDNVPLRRMSNLTMALLESIDYGYCAKQRRTNFARLHQQLAPINKLELHLAEKAIPMAYPLWVENGLQLRDALRHQRIYCAQYWPKLPLAVAPDSVEHALQRDLVALPLDQRYGITDMERILAVVDVWLNMR